MNIDNIPATILVVDDDAVVIIVYDSGGSGTFYNVSLAINIDGGYQGTDAILLGDRVIPQQYYIEDNRGKVEYLTRAFNESFAIAPSHNKSIHLQYDRESFRLIEVAVDFEGEADPDVLTVTLKPWKWIKTIYNNDTEENPAATNAFILTFKDNGAFSATTDCNVLNGAYKIDEHKITFENIAATMKYCENSQEHMFTKMLKETQSFFFTGRGELILELKFDTGSVIFR